MSTATDRAKVLALEGADVFRVLEDNGSPAATIIVHPQSGFFAVVCGWYKELNGCHWWCHRGGQSLYAFLRDLEFDYTEGKLFDRHGLSEYDNDATIAHIKAWIIEERRTDSMTRKQARDLWDDLWTCESDEEVMKTLRDSDIGIDEPWAMLQHSPKSCVRYFRETIWPRFIEFIKDRP